MEGEAAQSQNGSAGRAAPALIFFIVFLDLLGVGLIAPLTPYIVERFDPTATAVSILTLAYSGAQFLATPVLGVLSDRFGRRPVLMFSLLGTAAGYVLFALANSLPLLIIARVIAGVSGGNISTAQAYIADVTAPENRAKSFGLIGAAFGLGFTLGPAFGGLLAPLGLMTPVWAACGLSLVAAALVFFVLPETLPPERRRREAIGVSDFNPVKTLVEVCRLPGLATLIAAVFFFSFAHAEMRTSFGVLLRDKLEFTEQSANWMFAYMGLLAVLVQGGLVRRLGPVLGDARTVLLGLPLAALGYCLIPLGSTWVLVGAALTVLAVGGGLAQPTLTSIVSKRAPVEQLGRTMAASQATSALALVVGPIAAGQLYDHAGRGWPFWTGAMALGVALWLVTVSLRRAGAGTPSVESLGGSANVV